MNRRYEVSKGMEGCRFILWANEFEGNLEELMRINGLYSAIALIEEHITYKSPSGKCYYEELRYSLARFSATQPDRNRFYFDSLSNEWDSYWFGIKSGGFQEETNTYKVQNTPFVSVGSDDYIKREKTDLIDVCTQWRICELVDCYDDSVPNICFSLLGDSNGKD